MCTQSQARWTLWRFTSLGPDSPTLPKLPLGETGNTPRARGGEAFLYLRKDDKIGHFQENELLREGGPGELAMGFETMSTGSPSWDTGAQENVPLNNSSEILKECYRAKPHCKLQNTNVSKEFLQDPERGRGGTGARWDLRSSGRCEGVGAA